MVIAGSDKTTRRRAVRRPRAEPPPSFGAQLRQAREALDLSLLQIQDRTGVRSRDLEALEQSDLTPFPDERVALVAVRRFADTVGLDGVAMSRIVEAQWRAVTESSYGERAQTIGAAPVVVWAQPPAPAPAPAAPPVAATTATGVSSGPPSRHPGDTSHLRAFTQTAQVPQVGSRTQGPTQTASHTLPPGLRFDSTDSLPVTVRSPVESRRASPVLLVAVWSAVLLLVLGAVGISIDHWRPAWLAKIHLVSGPPTTTHRSHGGASTGASPRITETSSGPGLATVTVPASEFQVVVATQGPCWIHVTTPLSVTPLFSATVPPGTTKIFTSGHGQLSLELGASRVLVAVQIRGKTVPGWLFAPSAVPEVVNFRSATT